MLPVEISSRPSAYLSDARAHHRNHPRGIALWIANIPDHLIEISDRALAADGTAFADRFRIAIAPGGFAGSATRVKDLRLCRQSVPAKQWRLLRPDRSRLRIQVPHHGFVGHLLGLRVQVCHGDLSSLRGAPAAGRLASRLRSAHCNVQCLTLLRPRLMRDTDSGYRVRGGNVDESAQAR